MKLSKFEKLFYRLLPNFILKRMLPRFSKFKFFKETLDTQTPVSFEYWYNQQVLQKNAGPYWPVHFTSTVSGWKNVYCGIETCPGYSPGNYISAFHGKVYIGDYTQIAPNVGIISSNHDVYDNAKHISNQVVIGKYCWIGMGAIVLPGVELGDFTIVAAGAMVTKSFKEGYCVIGGNPAHKIKSLEQKKCIRNRSKHEYNGYIPSREFEAYRKKHLNV
jgi:carbonic anhydrase/acetyltransferase-like protein (isoleucine patch superfamily)